MEHDARTLQLLLYLSGRSLVDFEPCELPKPIQRFLEKADRASLQTCLVEILCRLESPPSGGEAKAGRHR